MRRIFYILIVFSLLGCISDYEQIDYYIADTTLSIWSEKFNYAIEDVTTDTIELGVDSLLTWSYKINKFIDTVPGFDDDTIIYGSDNFEGFRTKFNNALVAYLDSVFSDSLVLYLTADSIPDDSLTYNSSGNLVTYVSVDTVVLDGSSEVVIGNSVRFEASSTNYQIIDTLGSSDSLILDQTFTGSITDEFLWGGVDTWYDISDNTYIGTTGTGTPKLIFNNRLRFNGVDDNIQLDDGGDLNPLNDFTWYLKYKPTNVTRFQNGRILQNNYLSNGYELYDDVVQIRVQKASGNETHSLTNDSSLTNNITYDLVITKESDVYTLYINGIAHEPETFTSPVLATIFDLIIGSTRIPNAYTSMELYELRMWERVLSYKQIQYLSGNSCESLVPKLTLPDTITLLANETYTIYNDDIAALHMDDDCTTIEYTCSVGSDVTDGYNFNEVVIDTGYYNIKVTANRFGEQIDKVESIIRIIEPITAATSTDLLMVGNSVTFLGAIVDSIKSTTTGGVIDLFGTLGSGNHIHEGNPGYGIRDYVTNAKILLSQRNPFWDGSQFNYSNYRIDSISSPTPMNIVIVQLGINTANDIPTDSYIDNTWLPQMQEFVDSLLLDNTTHIMICMPPKCTNDQQLWDDHYSGSVDINQYMDRMQYIWGKINTTFSGGRYGDNVYSVANGVFIDRDNYNDYVHPSTEGNYEITKPVRALIEYVLKYK